MIIHLKCNDQVNLNITIDIDDYSYWKQFYYKYYCGLENNLADILEDLNCKRQYKSMPIIDTKSFTYKNLIEDYYRYCLRLSNQLLFNQYIDKLIKLHIENLEYEKQLAITSNIPVKIDVKQKRKQNRYIKEETKDLFTGKTTFIYQNYSTGDVINSDDPNLLDSLNITHKKEKHIKIVPIALSNMTFSFKKKKT